MCDGSARRATWVGAEPAALVPRLPVGLQQIVPDEVADEEDREDLHPGHVAEPNATLGYRGDAVRPSATLPAGLELKGRYAGRGADLERRDGRRLPRGRPRGRTREVAVKRLTDVRHAARFEIEARLLAQLRHPRVVRVHRLLPGRVRPVPRDGARRGRRPRRRAQAARRPGPAGGERDRVRRQACEALQYVHEQQIVHRDVKPQNLILGEEGIMLVDFGDRARAGRARTTGTVGIGTPRFMAPEVFAGGAVSPRSDVFGLAATAVDAARRASRPSMPTRRSCRSSCPASRPSSRRRSRPGSR